MKADSIVVLENRKSDDVTQRCGDHMNRWSRRGLIEDVLDPTVPSLCYQTRWRRILSNKDASMMVLQQLDVDDKIRPRLLDMRKSRIKHAYISGYHSGRRSKNIMNRKQ